MEIADVQSHDKKSSDTPEVPSHSVRLVEAVRIPLSPPVETEDSVLLSLGVSQDFSLRLYLWTNCTSGQTIPLDKLDSTATDWTSAIAEKHIDLIELLRSDPKFPNFIPVYSHLSWKSCSQTFQLWKCDGYIDENSQFHVLNWTICRLISNFTSKNFILEINPLLFHVPWRLFLYSNNSVVLHWQLAIPTVSFWCVSILLYILRHSLTFVNSLL